MTSRWARLIRGQGVAVFATFAAGFSHGIGDGAHPPLVAMALALAFSGVACVFLASGYLHSRPATDLGVDLAATDGDPVAPFRPAVPHSGAHGAGTLLALGVPLADGQRTTFALAVKLPEASAGERLDFPVAQECEVGSTDWAESAVAGEPEPEHLEPSMVLTTASGAGQVLATASAADTSAAAGNRAASGSDDIVARVLGASGLVLGTIGLMVGLKARRKEETTCGQT
ncbi:MAG: DUF1775 domain-containing protein [Homoserinimonas sp.]